MEIQYTVGDATRPRRGGNRIICHVCNDVGAWGLGFVLALSQRWPQPQSSYFSWHAERERNDFALGAVQFVRVEGDIWVANIVGQQGLDATAEGPPVRYDAIERGLHRVADRAESLPASIHMPRIGCGLAGGAWEQVEALIGRSLLARDLAVTVYDLA